MSKNKVSNNIKYIRKKSDIGQCLIKVKITGLWLKCNMVNFTSDSDI